MSTSETKRHCYIFFVLSLSVQMISSDDIKIKWEEEFSNLGYCLAEIIDNIESEVLKMSIFGASKWSDLTKNILQLIDVPVLIDCVEYPKGDGLETRAKNDLIVILNDSIEADEILRQSLWHGDTRFVILFDGDMNEDVFQDFWEKKVINVYALVQEGEDVIVYSFLPYGPGNCNAAEPILLDKWSNGTFLGNGITKIKDKIRITNMNRCPVNVTIVDLKPQVFFHDDCSCNGSHRVSGIEGNIMNEIAKKLNMEATYVIALDGVGWGWIKPTPHGVAGEVYTGRSDFGMGLLAPTVERYENLDLSVPYEGGECVTYGVHKGSGAKQPTWIMMLVFEFEGLMWMLIALVFIILLFNFWFIVKTLGLPVFRKKFDLFILLFGSCLGNPIKTIPSGTFRIAIISWIVFTFIITVAYKSSMGSKLSVPTPDPDIDSFKELLKSGLKLTGYNNMLRLMQYNDSDADIKLMAERFVVTNFDLDHAIDAIVKHEKIAHVRHMSTFSYYSLINPRARGHIHYLKDCIYSYDPLFVMKKNSPFRRRANQVIYSLREGGIVRFWKSKYIYDLPKKPNTFEKLTLGHTFGMFFILFLGYCASITIFICERVYFRVDESEMVKKEMKRLKIQELFLKTKRRNQIIRKFKRGRHQDWHNHMT